MEQIKDMVTLRAFAYDEALRHGAGTEKTFAIAKEIESYILGGTKLPELYDEKAQIESWKKIFFDAMPKGLHREWIKPIDMLPKQGEQVLVMCKDRKYPLFGEYIGEDYWEVSDADVILRSKFNEVVVVAWLPIPEYKG